MKELSLQNISSHMGGEVILHSVNFSMDRGERLCLLGPSGCGKTTLLRIVAGLDPCHGGQVLFRGNSIKALSPHHRNFGMMFQDFALFPHRNVFQNIAFGLEMKRKSKGEIAHRVAQMLELVGLSVHGDRRVTELSGGERQRVALARTLAPAPDLIMLDEPLGALDRLLRERLLSDLCTILEKTRITTILVTHDQQEAFAVGDRICVMSQGRVEQINTPVRLYNHPANRTVADFLGFQNIVERGISFPGNGIVTIAHGSGVAHFTLPHGMDRGRDGGKKVAVLFLPDGGTIVSDVTQNRSGGSTVPERWGGCEDSTCHQKKQGGEQGGIFTGGGERHTRENRISGVLEESFFQGSMVRIRVNTLFGHCFSFDVPARGRLPEKGGPVEIAIDPESIRVIHG